MASGHVNRANRPNTWLHRPACDVKKVLANSEPSTHGHFSDVRSGGDHVRSRGQSGPPDFVGRLPKMTPSRTFTVLDTATFGATAPAHGVGFPARRYGQP